MSGVVEVEVVPRGRCLGCGYLLEGLTECRCPECGREFDPGDLKTMDMRGDAAERWERAWRVARDIGARVWKWVRPKVPVLVCLGLSWWMATVSDRTLPLLFWVPGLLLVVMRRWISVGVFAALSPLMVITVGECVSYARGSVWYVNGSSPIWHDGGSIDPVTRVRGRHPGGCGMQDGLEQIRIMARGVAPAVMYRVMGPPPGAYTGPYPTQAEAVAALKNGTRVKLKEWTSGGVTGGWEIEGKGLDVGSDTMRRVLYEPRVEGVAPSAEEMKPWGVAWKGSCVVVCVPEDAKQGLMWRVYLIDMGKMEMFGMYIVGKGDRE